MSSLAGCIFTMSIMYDFHNNHVPSSLILRSSRSGITTKLPIIKLSHVSYGHSCIISYGYLNTVVNYFS